MALISCKECNKEVSSEAKGCPHCGVTLIPESVLNSRKATQKGCLFVFIGFFGLIFFSALFSEGKQAPSKKMPHLDPNIYVIQDQWDIRNGGVGQVVILDTKNVTEKSIIQAGNQIRANNMDQKNVFAYIFSNKKAASLYSMIDYLNKSEEKIYDNGFVGRYFKNGNTGYESLVIYPTGKSKVIKF